LQRLWVKVGLQQERLCVCRDQSKLIEKNQIRNIEIKLTKEKDNVKLSLFRDMGIVPNVSLLAFEKIPQKFYSDVLLNKTDNTFKDIQAKP